MFIRFKKGDVTTPYIIAALLGLIALFILAFIFKEQISSFAEKFMGFGNQLDAARKGTACEDFFSDRKCYIDSCTAVGEKAKTAGDTTSIYRNAIPTSNSWSDCPSPKSCCIRTV